MRSLATVAANGVPVARSSHSRAIVLQFSVDSVVGSNAAATLYHHSTRTSSLSAKPADARLAAVMVCLVARTPEPQSQTVASLCGNEVER